MLVRESKMKRDKILISVSNIEDIKEYKKLGITNFLFPLKDYSVGYPAFSFAEISSTNVRSFVFINRLLEDDDIDKFVELDIPKNVKGFVIEDIGLLEILKRKGYEVILYQNHLNNCYKTVNHWLKDFDSVVISTDITKEEIKLIIDKSTKNLVLNTFGFPLIMYSRRLLVSNFTKHIGATVTKEMTINEERKNQDFFLKENEYGTAIFYSIPFDYRSIIEELDYNLKYYLINTAYMDINTIKDVITGKVVDANRGFLDEKTIYRIGDIK